MLKYKIFKQVADMIYGMILRPLLVKAIDNPDEEWDDDVLKMVDAFFEYKA